jgi:hypothetical protein
MMLMSFLEKHFHKQRTSPTKKGKTSLKTIPTSVTGYYNIRVRNTLFGCLFYFSDVIATCFGPLPGHRQEILTEMYHETIFYNGSAVSNVR